jgi:hypothetical protein
MEKLNTRNSGVFAVHTLGPRLSFVTEPTSINKIKIKLIKSTIEEKKLN